MPVPKKRTSRSVRNMRRSHHHLSLDNAVEDCPNCGALKQRHRVCPSCGQYRGRAVIVQAPDVDEARA